MRVELVVDGIVNLERTYWTSRRRDPAELTIYIELSIKVVFWAHLSAMSEEQ
jgi:hypothetical protein